MTVILYIDGDHGIETFVEEVTVRDPSKAYDAAVRKAKASGCSSTGYSISRHEWECATEIATFYGHNLDKNPAVPKVKPAAKRAAKPAPVPA